MSGRASRLTASRKHASQVKKPAVSPAGLVGFRGRGNIGEDERGTESGSVSHLYFPRCVSSGFSFDFYLDFMFSFSFSLLTAGNFTQHSNYFLRRITAPIFFYEWQCLLALHAQYKVRDETKDCIHERQERMYYHVDTFTSAYNGDCNQNNGN